MASKRNAALEAIGGAPKATSTPPEPELQEAPAAPPRYTKVMVYMPPKVARKFKEMAFHEDRKANDVYLDAIDLYLQKQGHGGIKGVVGG